jgi:pyruvate/2-oxoglutarate/acetoin dehydrogenase E1 component
MRQGAARPCDGPEGAGVRPAREVRLGGLTDGLHEARPEQVITFPVCENLMNGAAMGLALAGYRPVVIHERMDFLAVGMDPLVNHIPVWPARAPMSLPLVIFAVVGKGKGQGPQHSKNLAPGSRCSRAGRWCSRDHPGSRRR